MLSLENDIIRYLYAATDGKTQITFEQAKQIIRIVTGTTAVVGTAHVVIYRLDPVLHTEIVMRTVNTTDEKINTEIIAALDRPPTNRCFMYKCYNTEKEYQGCIFTTDPNLFN